MKKIFCYICTAVLAVSIVTSCQNSDWDYDNLFPEEYNTVFSIKGETSVTQTISQDDESSEYVITVLKGGAQPTTVADVQLALWSESEVEAYGADFGREYRLLPADAYQLSATSLHFDGTERGKDVVVRFISSKIAQYVIADTEKTYILPLRLVSDKSVDSDSDEVLITIAMDAIP